MRTLTKQSETLYTWRNLELSYSSGPKDWSLAFSASRKRLPCGASDRQFPSLWQAKRYLESHGYVID